MNFAPYQSSPPESTRALSPPPRSPNASPPAQRAGNNKGKDYFPSIADQSDPWAASRAAPRLPSPSTFAEQDRYRDVESGQPPLAGGGGGGGGGGGREQDVFETSLGLRMGIEASLAYLILPPAGGVVLLLFEHKSDYVRFHAWQSSLVFASLFILHLVLSWSSVLSWMLFAADLVLIGYMTFHAYRDAETLDRLELPFFGRLSSNFVDSE